METKFLSGKLPSAFLQKLIKKLPILDSSVLIPAGIGFDAAGVMIGNQLVAITTDPITLTSDKIGTYSVAVNINDVACLGCKPRWFSAALLLPVGISQNAVEAIWNNLAVELERYDICAIGGHTEITSAVNAPVLVGQMIGEVIGDNLLNLKNAQSGDEILLWQPIAIEGTALLAERKQQFLRKYLPQDEIIQMQNLLFTPGICIWPMVKKLIPCPGVVAIHDPTEGGIATALHEMADAAGLGIEVNADAIAILPETKKLADLLHFDPLGLLASGSALIVCRSEAIESVQNKLSGEPLALIGEFNNSNDRVMMRNGKLQPLPRYDRDGSLRLFKIC